MKVTFLGTRGYIDPENDRHRMHTTTLFAHRGERLLLDWGETWRGRLDEVAPDAIAITHAHPDHAFGLDDGAHCPVWASEETWDRIKEFPIEDAHRRVFPPRKPEEVLPGITLEAFPVVHSVRAPAVGYRVTAGGVALFYVPDVVHIPDRAGAFRGIRAYVGDGATLHRKMVRKHKGSGALVGHATMKQQVRWCLEEAVPEFLVTHCGSDVVGGDEARILARLREEAEEAGGGLRVTIAHDGMTRVFRAGAGGSGGG